MSDSTCLLEEVSPNGNIQATVEQDDRVAYFYLRGAADSGFEFKACWVRNLVAAPTSTDAQAMKNGNAPRLPAGFCRHPKGAVPLKKKDLRVVWFEEGDAAAVLEKDEILAIIPSWSGYKGFAGFARDCIGDSPLCWELDADNVLNKRVERSDKWWADWDAKKGIWSKVQTAQCDAYTEQIGPYQKYFAIDGGDWPPKAMVKIEKPEATILSTVGVCLRPQPNVEMSTEEPELLRRVEFGLAMSPNLAKTHFNEIAGYLSGQSRYPWSSYTWLGPFHTLGCDVLESETDFSSVLLVPSPKDAPRVALPKFRRDPVNFLWFVPITEDERQFAIDNTPDGGKRLSKLLADAGHGWIWKKRRSVV